MEDRNKRSSCFNIILILRSRVWTAEGVHLRARSTQVPLIIILYEHLSQILPRQRLRSEALEAALESGVRVEVPLSPETGDRGRRWADYIPPGHRANGCPRPACRIRVGRGRGSREIPRARRDVSLNSPDLPSGRPSYKIQSPLLIEYPFRLTNRANSVAQVQMLRQFLGCHRWTDD